MQNKICQACAFFICLISLPAVADVKLPAIFGDNMVLQQKARAAVWGWAEPGEKIIVKGSWQFFGATCRADKDGRWMVNISTPAAGGPHTLTIQGKNKITVNQILSGEVWVCSGQSNMEWAVKSFDKTQQEIAQADYPKIRLFTVQKAFDAAPQQECQGQWQMCGPATVESFSAAGYFFGRQLHQKLNVPIGLICTSWGGTPAEAWASQKNLQPQFPEFSPIIDAFVKPSDNSEKWTQCTPTALFNGMVSPLIPFQIAGVIWYQGESNVGRHHQYAKLFPAMITDWRKCWGIGDFPFYYVQIAPYVYNDGLASSSALLRDAQTKTLAAIPNVGMASTIDIGMEKDIHPTNKQEVGRRLSLLALANHYDRKDLVFSGPMYKSMKIEGGKIRILFDYAQDGLVAKGGDLTDFVIAGSDSKFVPAKAIIENNTVVVSSERVKEPAVVRFAWTNWTCPNLYNKAGLPANQFATDGGGSVEDAPTTAEMYKGK